MPVMSRPSNRIVPEVGGTSQVSILKKVDLAGAVRADDAAQLAVIDGEIDVAVGDQAAVALGQAAGLQDRPRGAVGRAAARRVADRRRGIGRLRQRRRAGAGAVVRLRGSPCVRPASA